MQGKKKTVLVYMGVLAVLVIGVYMMSSMIRQTGDTYSYSDIVYMFRDGLVKSYSLNLGSGEIQMEIDMTNDKADEVKATAVDSEGNKYVTTQVAYLSKFIDDIEPYVEQYNVDHAGNEMEYNFIAATDNSWIDVYKRQSAYFVKNESSSWTSFNKTGYLLIKLILSETDRKSVV